MELTPHQKEKQDIIIDAVCSGLNRIVLTGSAGVGKTTLVNYLIRKFMSPNSKVYLTAPTHKALAVLKSKIGENGSLVFSTIHAALKMKKKYSSDGKITFEQDYHQQYPPFPQCSLLIIDEASMLNDTILDTLKQYHFPIIFIGDEKQINPVHEEHSPVFHQHWFTVELTQIIRQGEGNPIIELSRNLPLIKAKVENLTSKKHGYLYTQDRQKVIKKLAEVNGTDALKYLAWTNNEVDSINYSVRHHIYGDNPAMIEEGEVIVLSSSYNAPKKKYHTNEEVKVETLSVIDKKVYPPGEEPEIMALYLINNNISVVHEESLALHKTICKKIKKSAVEKRIDWVAYYKYIESFAEFTYNHAITIHKSQGSTYKDVIINIKDVNRNRIEKEKQRLLYTAVTRASQLLILYNT